MSSKRSAAHTRETIEIVYLTMRQEVDVSEIASQVGCSLQRVRYWQRKLRQAQYEREDRPNGYGCEDYKPAHLACEMCLDNPEEPCPRFGVAEEGSEGGV